MHDGFNRIFWGMCFVTFHITIFGFEGLPLPAFIAYFMVWSGIKQLMDEPQSTGLNEAYESQSPNHYFKRAAAIALVSALIAVPRVAPAIFNQFLAQHPLAALLNFGLISLLDLGLAYYLLTGAACLLEIQLNSGRKAFYLKRLRAYLVLVSIFSVIGIAALALGELESSIVFSIAVLILRIWFIMLIHGLKPAPDEQPSTVPSTMK